MGINIDGARDLVSAGDGSLTIEGFSINSTGIGTFTGGIKIGTAASIFSNGNITSGIITASAADLQTGPLNVGTAATISANGNATFSGITTFGGNINANGNIVGDNSTDISGINDITVSALIVGDSIAHTGDTDTKIRFPSADTFTAETAGSERLRIRADGRTSIGSSLAVAGVCTAAAFVPSEGQLSNRRININGAMQVWQRSTSASDIGGSNGYFACDRYRSSNNGAGRHTISRDTDEPGGFDYSMKIDVTTAVSSPSANNYTFIQHRLTGSDVQPFAKGTSSAQKYALSFWVKSPKTGVHCVQLEDVENSRSVQGSYTIASADTWEKHTIIFPAETSNGISGDSSHRMQLYFWLFAGSTYNNGNVASLGTTWGSTGSISRASGQVNCFDNTSNNFYITGIQFEVGSYATPFEHARYDDELRKCQYYYQKTDGGGCGVGVANGTSNGARIQMDLKTTMRANPTVSKFGSNNIYIYDGSAAVQVSTISQTYGSTHSVEWEFNALAAGDPLTAGRPIIAYINGSAGGLQMTSEL